MGQTSRLSLNGSPMLANHQGPNEWSRLRHSLKPRPFKTKLNPGIIAHDWRRLCGSIASFSCRFSSSSCRSRRASLTSIPPYFAFQRYRLPRVIPCRLAARLKLSCFAARTPEAQVLWTRAAL
jgi:hypothetical protein